MAESREGERKENDSWFENTYKQWLEFYGKHSNEAKKFAIDQTLHKASLMEIKVWDINVTPQQIATDILNIAPEEAEGWINRRNEFPTRQLEFNKSNPGFRRVFSVKSELINKLREEKKT
jgi:hypothetical protein